MAINANKQKRFSTKLDVFGENAEIIKKGLEAKMKAESRKTYNNAIEAALKEYFTSKSNKAK